MPVIRSLLTHFGFKIEGGKLQSFQRQVTATKGRLRVAARESRRLRSEMRGIGNMARYAVAAFIGSRFVRIFTTGYAKTLDEAMKFSRQIGINVESLQALGYAAGEANVGSKELQVGLLRFSRSLRDAQEGSKKIVKAFSDVGISVRDLPLEDQEKTLMILADRFKDLPAGANKAALAQELFGRSGAKLIPLLNEGSVGLERLMKKARELGVVMSEKDAKAAEDFNNQLTASKAALTGLRNAIARQVLPYLTRMFRGFQRWIREGDNAKRLLETLKKVAIVTGVILAGIVSAKVIKLFKSFNIVLRGSVTWLKNMAKAGLFAHIKMLLLLGLLAAFVLAVEDLHAFAVGKRSLIGDALGEDSEKAKELRKILLDFGKELKKTGAELWKALKPILPILLKGFMRLVVFVTKFIVYFIFGLREVLRWADIMAMRFGEIAESIVMWFRNTWAKISATTSKVVNFVVGIWTSGINAIKAAWQGIGDAVKTVANAVGNAWKASLGWVLDQVKWITDKVIGAAERLGIIKGGSLAKASLGAFAGIRLPGGRTQVSNRASVGTLNVNVSGSADMSAPEFQGAVKGGALEALNELVKSSFADLRPVVS